MPARVHPGGRPVLHVSDIGYGPFRRFPSSGRAARRTGSPMCSGPSDASMTWENTSAARGAGGPMIGESKLGGPEYPEPPAPDQAEADAERDHAERVGKHQAETGWSP